MYRPSLTVAAVVVLLTLVCTAGATNGPGLPPKNCKLKTSKAKCLDLKAKGKCTKPNVFLKCQKVCDPRCQLGKPKPKCKNKKPDSFCEQKKHKCDKTHIMNKCKKTCGKCQVCDNRVDDAVCDLVSELGWCISTNLFELCRETCDPRCVPCDDCEDTCVSNSAVQKTCGPSGVCLLDEIIPCENKCDGDKVVKHVCKDGKCVQDGVKPCTDKCYGDILVPVICEKGKCKYGAEKICSDECRGDTAVHRTCDGGKCVDESSTDCVDRCEGITAVDVGCKDGVCAEVGRTDCVDKCDGDSVVTVLCDGGKCEDQGSSLCEDTCDGDGFVLDRVCSGGKCEDGPKIPCVDKCDGETRVEMKCRSGQCEETDRENCESFCDGDTANVVGCVSGMCDILDTETCSDLCENNNAIEWSCENGACEMGGVTPCDPVCANNVLTQMVCDVVGGVAQCVMGNQEDCPCGCRDDGACIPDDQCCMPGDCTDECKDNTTIQLKTCERDQCVDSGTKKCEDECATDSVVALRECANGVCICTGYEVCEDECGANNLSVLKKRCSNGDCTQYDEELCMDRCESDQAITVECGIASDGRITCMDVDTTPCKCGCEGDVCAAEDSCCVEDPECATRNPTTCDAGDLVEYFCVQGDCEPTNTPCKCGCDGDACAADTSCCLDTRECEARNPTTCNGGVLSEYFCNGSGDCEEKRTDCKCGCADGVSCLSDDSCCATDDECGTDTCVGSTLTTFECDAVGDCDETTTDCKCGCKFGDVACESDDSCCVDDVECPSPSCDSASGVLTTWACDGGNCVDTTETCTCGCDGSGMACVDPNSCCTTTCDLDEVLQDPDSGSCQCRECVNDKMGATKDTGCSDSEPLCGAADGEYGDQCFKCKDDGDGQDSGCPAGQPNCEPTDYPFGDTCFFCINDEAGATVDTGCSDSEPLCDAPEDQEGDACFVCLNDETGATTDTGCSDGTPLCGAEADEFGDECFVCLNDKGEGQGADTGCSGNPDKPNCRANDGEYGSECFGTTCQLADIDLCISVDGSGSISGSDWIIEKKFVTDLVAAFANEQGANPLWSGNQFSTTVQDIVTTFVDSVTFDTAVDAMNQMDGYTNIGDAIENCKDKLEDSNLSQSSSKVYILISDGARNRGPSETDTLSLANALKNTAEIFTIGAGTDGSTDQFLKNVASDPSLFFEASSVTAINEVLQEIITRLCETTEIP